MAPSAACFLKAEVARGRNDEVTDPSRERPYAATLEEDEGIEGSVNTPWTEMR